MEVYLILLIVIFILLFSSAIHLVNSTHKILKKHINNKFLSWILSFIPLLLFIPGFFIDIVNTIVVDIHLIIIIALTKVIFSAIGSMYEKEVNKTFVLILGIIITILVMVYGYHSAYNVVETDYTVYTTKNIGLSNFRIVQISDSHLGSTMDGKEFSKYMDDINKLNPDIVVITGDFVDDNTPLEYLIDGANGLGKLKTNYGVYFVYGNHDKGYYNNREFNDDDIRRELKNNNVRILEDEVVNLTNKIVLIGRYDSENKNRTDAIYLTRNLDKSKYMIMLDHEPNDYDNEMKSGVDLVLSGHTHGGQLFPLGQLGLLLGSNDKIYGMEQRWDTTFIVNSGISDWAIKFKTGTKSEYVVVDIKKKKN